MVETKSMGRCFGSPEAGGGGACSTLHPKKPRLFFGQKKKKLLDPSMGHIRPPDGTLGLDTIRSEHCTWSPNRTNAVAEDGGAQSVGMYQTGVDSNAWPTTPAQRGRGLVPALDFGGEERV